MNDPAATPAAPDRLAARSSVLLFLACLGAHLWVMSLGWRNPPVDGHEFRQTQTAISIRYLDQDGLTLAYPTPVLGKPWSIPLEFPWYQWSTVVVAHLTGLPLESAARATAVLYFYLTLPALWLLGRQAGLSRPAACLPLAAILSCPLYLFYPRAIMIESTALCGGAWFLWAWWSALRRPHLVAVVVGLGAGGLAAAVKLTSFAAVLPAAGFILVHEWRQRTAPPRRLLAVAAVLAGGSIAAGLLWSLHADTIKAQNPLAGFLASRVVGAWGLGPPAMRWSGEFWASVTGTTLGSILGPSGLTVLVLALGLAASDRRRLALALVAAFAAGPLVFANLHRIHDYYFFPSALFLAAAFGLALDQLLTHGALPRAVRLLLATALLAGGFIKYGRGYHHLIPENAGRSPVIARAIGAATQPHEVVVFLGHDWNPLLPYLAGRRALMIPEYREKDVAAIDAAIAQLRDEAVGALVVIGRSGPREDAARAIIHRLDLASEPVVTGEFGRIYLRRAAADHAVGALAALALPGFTVQAPSGRLRTDNLPAAQRAMFAMMSPHPREVLTAYGLSLSHAGDRPLFSAHPVTELVFRVPVGARRLRAEFGILPAAFADPPRGTDGVNFDALLLGEDGTTRPLASQLVQPSVREADREPRRWDLELPEGFKGDLLLRTGAGPAGDLSFDWAYWSQISLE